MRDNNVVFFRAANGDVPVLDWLETIPVKALDKCVVRIERLKELGHGLRRPEADYLRDGIYELRTRYQAVNYRILYFFCEKKAIVLAHGLTKRKEVPAKEIELSIRRKDEFEKNPDLHTMKE